MSNKFKRRSEYGKGWDGRSRVSNKEYKDNYNQIDWSSVNKKEDRKNGQE